jgi:hypothetical protein
MLLIKNLKIERPNCLYGINAEKGTYSIKIILTAKKVS